jgi:hypothetical protein
MKNPLNTVNKGLMLMGVNSSAFGDTLLRFPQYIRESAAFRKMLRESCDSNQFRFVHHPQLHDRYAQSGSASGHYFYQDLYVAQRIYRHRPIRHIDVASRIDGFVAHVASYRQIEVIDIRKLDSHIENIIFRQGNIMDSLSPELIDCTDSLSCLHALEHFGLGRYGDPLDPAGHTVGLRNLTAMLSKAGRLYLSVPIGPQRIEFNSHRVFSVEYILDLISASFHLEDFSYVDDQGLLRTNPTMTQDAIRNSFRCRHGCGIFTLIKK